LAITAPVHIFCNVFNHCYAVWCCIAWGVNHCGACGDAVGWGSALQARRSRVWFPMVSLEYFIDIIFSATLWPWGSLIL
jgi:hypothetical protein